MEEAKQAEAAKGQSLWERIVAFFMGLWAFIQNLIARLFGSGGSSGAGAGASA